MRDQMVCDTEAAQSHEEDEIVIMTDVLVMCHDDAQMLS